MFKFIIVFCVAAFASAAYVSAQEDPDYTEWDEYTACEGIVKEAEKALVKTLDANFTTGGLKNLVEMAKSNANRITSEIWIDLLHHRVLDVGIPHEKTCIEMFTNRSDADIQQWMSNEENIPMDKLTEREKSVLPQVFSNHYIRYNGSTNNRIADVIMLPPPDTKIPNRAYYSCEQAMLEGEWALLNTLSKNFTTDGLQSIAHDVKSMAAEVKSANVEIIYAITEPAKFPTLKSCLQMFTKQCDATIAYWMDQGKISPTKLSEEDSRFLDQLYSKHYIHVKY